MRLADYFESVKGVGILGTADAEGKVDLALYARPHTLDEETVAFIMGDRRSHTNVAANPHAAYLFLEDTQGYRGLRLHLTKTREETDPKQIGALRRKGRAADDDFAATKSFLVQFKVDEVRPLTKEQRPAGADTRS